VPRGGQPVRYTTGPRWRLLRLFARALAWNLRHLRSTLARRRAFRTFLQDEYSSL
jgi:hypothetical protein